MKTIKLNEWATLTTYSKEEYNEQFPDSEQDQVNPTTDLDNDPEINPSTDRGGKETSDQLADVLKKLSNGTARQSMRSLDRMEVTERKANEPAKPEPEATRASETSETLAKMMERIRGQQ